MTKSKAVGFSTTSFPGTLVPVAVFVLRALHDPASVHGLSRDAVPFGGIQSENWNPHLL